MDSNKIRLVLEKIAEWSLYLLIFALPFSKSIIEIMIVTALVSLIISKVIARDKPIIAADVVDIPLYIFLFISLASLVNTSYMALSLRALFSKTLKFAALFLITREIINTRNKLKNFAVVALSSCILIVIDGFIQYFITHVDFLHGYRSFKFVTTEAKNLGAVTASFPFPNDLSAWILAFIFPVGMVAFWGKRNLVNRLFYVLTFASLGYLLILTKVRGAWASFLIVACIAAFIKIKKRILIPAILLFSIVLSLNKPVVEYITAMTSINDRSVMWKNSVEIFKRHPIIGSGLNTFYVNYAKVRTDEYRDRKGSYAHNCYLQMVAEIGLAGLISFLIFAAAIMIKCLREAKKINDPFYNSLILGIGLGLTAFLAHSAVDTNLYSLNLAALFWISAGILMAAVRIAGSDI